MKKRILVISHGHPDFSLGGGEIAAYNLFKTYLTHRDVEDAWFLARAERGRGVTGQIHKRRDREYLWEQGISDWHLMKAAHQESVTSWFVDLIKSLRPSIVHIHHYAHLGLEFIRSIKMLNPNIKIFITLHEYMAICKHNGQMVKTGNNFSLCSSESFDECQKCFPENTAEDFWLRKHYFQSAFEIADGFVSPSQFLKDRYLEWGLDESKFCVIENGQNDLPTLPPRQLRKGETRSRFAFFGQINPYKGIDILLEAISSMQPEERRGILVEIHGSNLDIQSGYFQRKISEMASPLIEEGTVRWMGPYRPEDQRKILSQIDWVVVPSIWWENSPMVIQEAFVAGRPLIVSDIGGMAEKVSDMKDGLHFTSRNKLSLADVMRKAIETEELWNNLSSNITKPLSHKQCAEAHLKFFS